MLPGLLARQDTCLSLLAVSTLIALAGACGGEASPRAQGTAGAGQSSVPSVSGAGTTAGVASAGSSSASAGGVANNSGAGTGGSGSGGTRPVGTAGAGVAQAGSSAQAGAASSGSGSGTFTCPSGPYAATPVPSGATATRINGAPPMDNFIQANGDLIIMEGPVWLDGNLYVSEIENGPDLGFGGPGGGTPKDAPPGRILKVTEAGAVSVAFADAGSNGLALDPSGALVACSHKTGSVARLSLSGGAATDLVSSFMGARFDSPNDLAFGADGSLFFSDPDYQAPSPLPQTATRFYRVAPGSMTATAVIEGRREPNGVTFSADHKILYVSSSDGVFAYPVQADGSLGTGATFAANVARGSDGMGMDCAGNLYTTANQTVTIVSPAGAEVGRISVPGVSSVSNIAFGGADHKTIYITGNGSAGQTASSGVFKIAGAIPGMPY